MYCRPLFDRIENPEQISRQELIASIHKELGHILGNRTGYLPKNASAYDIKKWQCSIVQFIEDNEPRLRKVKINMINRIREHLNIEITGLLVFDNQAVCFNMQCW